MRNVSVDWYVDSITGERVEYLVSIPEQCRESYALIINLHSCHREPISQAKCMEMGWGEMERWSKVSFLNEYIIIHPMGFGNTLFAGVGEKDVIDCLIDIKSKHLIDASRILLVGFSMGGAGALNLASKSPHLFCGVASISGYSDSRLWKGPNRKPQCEVEENEIEKREAIFNLENLRYTNLYIAHGEWDVGVGGGVNFSHHKNIINRLKRRSIEYTEEVYENTSHAEFPIEKRQNVVNWMRRQYKKPFPEAFEFIVTGLRHSAFYDIEVKSLNDYSRKGKITGKCIGDRLELVTENIGTISVQGFESVSIDGKEGNELISSNLRGKSSPGPISDCLYTRVLFCYDDECDIEFSRLFQKEIATADCRFFKGLNGGISCGPFRNGYSYFDHQVIPTSQIPQNTVDHTVVIYGLPGSNPLVMKALEGVGFTIDEQGICLSSKTKLSGQLGVRFVSPREEGGYTITNTATDEKLIAQGFGIWYGSLPDFIVYDCEQITHYGYFDADWRFTDEFLIEAR